VKILIACEFSGVVRQAFRNLEHEAWSCDLLPAEDGSRFHMQGDVLQILSARVEPWDLMIAHPPCTRLCNSGVRWLHTPPKGKTKEQMWRELDQACDFYKRLRDAPIRRKCVENPIMHRYAVERCSPSYRQYVQPWWFGDKAFKAVGLELINLPVLQPTNKLTPPEKGTEEHAAWSKVHRASPGKDRWKERSRTYQGLAEAMAVTWGAL